MKQDFAAWVYRYVSDLEILGWGYSQGFGGTVDSIYCLRVRIRGERTSRLVRQTYSVEGCKSRDQDLGKVIIDIL